MKKYLLHSIFTATIKHWKLLFKPDKFKEIILEQLRKQIKIINVLFMPWQSTVRAGWE